MAVKIPVYIGLSIDILNGSLEQDHQQLQIYIQWVMALALLMVIVRTLSRICFFNPGRGIECEIKHTSLSHLSQLPSSFYRQYDSGTLISIINNDIVGIRALFGIVMLQIFNIVFALSLTPLFMWSISPSLTLYCMLPVILSFYISHYAVGYLRKHTKQRMNELQALSAATISNLNGREIIKANRIEHWAINHFAQLNSQLKKRSLTITRISTLFLPIMNYTDKLMKVLIIGVGGAFVIQADMSIGELTTFLAYSVLLARPFVSLGRIYSAFQMSMASIESLRKILDQTIPEQDTQHLSTQDRQQLFSQGIEVKYTHLAT